MSQEIGYEISDQTIRYVIDETVYPLDAIYGASYLFVDRCFLFFGRAEDQKIEIHMKKRTNDGDSLDDLLGQFCNELLNQVIRFRLAESTSKIREYYMARAFLSHPAQNSIDSLLAELDAEELEDDELEISVPWEQGDG